MRGAEAPSVHFPEEVFVDVVHAGYEFAPGVDDGPHVFSGGHVGRSSREGVVFVVGGDGEGRGVGVVGEDVGLVDSEGA